MLLQTVLRTQSSGFVPQITQSTIPSISLLYRNLYPRPRHFSSSPKITSGIQNVFTPARKQNASYNGPLATTFKRLKIFSLSSLTLSSTLAPFMFIVESNLPLTARFALASIAVGTSGISTGLVAWCGMPYVTTLRRLNPEENSGAEGVEMTTLNLFLRPKITTVYDPMFLVETKRAFAKWELAGAITLPAGKSIAPGTEETVAETTDKEGNIIGRWIVTWGDDGEGTCRQVGDIIRYFNVHEELLI